jgi:hypothetical protein
MTSRSSIPYYIDPNNVCFVVCQKHGRINSRTSQQGRAYHSCMYWNYLARQFTPRLAVSPTEQCTVNFVFCSEHSSNEYATPPNRLDNDIDAMAENKEVNEDEALLSHFLSPPSPQDHQLTLSQEILIQEFNELMNELSH